MVGGNTLPTSRLNDTAKLREVLDEISLKLDGTQAAAKTVGRKRAVIHNALEYADELKLVTANRLSEVKWKAPKTVRAIDKRVVVNPRQGRKLLAAVEAQKVDTAPRRSSGPMLKAFFAGMYYAALRPEEAAMLCNRTSSCRRAAGVSFCCPKQHRPLERRGPTPANDVTVVSSSSAEGAKFVAADGRLFRNPTGGDLSKSTIGRVWDNARKAALAEEEYASQLARRPYDLRHACVSTWLAAGVPSTQCAEWAGHSVAVLHQIYAAVLAGLASAAHQLIEQALDWAEEPDEKE